MRYYSKEKIRSKAVTVLPLHLLEGLARDLGLRDPWGMTRKGIEKYVVAHWSRGALREVMLFIYAAKW